MAAQTQTTGKSRWWVYLAVAAFVAGMVVLVVLNLPRGLDMDLDKIGDGKPAIVFVYDNNLSISNAQAGELDKIRDFFEDRLHLLVADTGRPQAYQWIAHHQARPADLFFFDAQGQLRHRQPAPLTADELTGRIGTLFDLESR